MGLLLVILAYCASKAVYLYHFLGPGVIILSSTVYSSDCTIAAMTLVSASLPRAAVKKLTEVAVSRRGTLFDLETGLVISVRASLKPGPNHQNDSEVL